MLEADTILWLVAVGLILIVLAAVLVGVISLDRSSRAADSDTPLVSLGKVALALGGFVVTVVTFAFITDSWMDEDRMHELDVRVYETLAELQMPVIVDVMQVVTWFGSTQAAIAALAILGIFFWTHRNHRQLVNLAIVFIPGSAALWLLKAIFGRARPGDALAPTAGHSFPSGHSFTATMIYGFLIYLAWDETTRSPFRLVLTPCLILLIATVAASRIILNAHWASDVMGGVMFGLAWLVSSLMISTITSHIIAHRQPSVTSSIR